MRRLAPSNRHNKNATRKRHALQPEQALRQWRRGDPRDRLLAPEIMRDLRAAFIENPILCIRDQSLTAAQQAAFSRGFGPLETQDRSKYCHPDDKDVLILSNDRNPDGSAIGIIDAGDFWHSDSSHIENPCRMTILYAVQNPQKGGDTQFCNLYRVYEALPDTLKRRVEG